MVSLVEVTTPYDGVTNAASWVGYIVREAGDDVNVRVKHCLSRSQAHVESDIETIGRPSQENIVTDSLDELPHARPLLVRALKVRLNVPPRNHEHMSGRHGILVFERDGKLRFCNGGTFDRTEWAA